MTQSNVTPRSPIHTVVDGGSTTGFRRLAMAKKIRNIIIDPTAPLWCFAVMAVMITTIITIWG